MLMPSFTLMKQAGCKRRAARPVDLDEAHATHPDRLHSRVVAEARHVVAGAFGGLDHELARRDLDARDRSR